MRRSDGVPAIIAHRGASGYRPEHTIASYQLAIEFGADYIEPDVVSTADGVLIARHENELSGTTNVADFKEFADRKTRKIVDGQEKVGWFSEDFTLAEIRMLRAKERLPHLRTGNTQYDGEFLIPTFEEILLFLNAANVGRERPVGVYVETKHPSYFASAGLDLTDPLLKLLSDYSPELVVIQSFESENLANMQTHWPRIRLLEKPEDISAFTFADGIGPAKNLVISDDGTETGLLKQAHELGLEVHVWTMRNENAFLPKRFQSSEIESQHGDAIAECLAFFSAGVDAVFSDFADTALLARSMWLSEGAAD